MKKFGVLFTFVFMTLWLSSITVFAGAWVKDTKGYWYRNDDGSYPKSAWQEIDKEWYYFDTNGYMVSNIWIGEYYLGAEGKMLKNTTTPDGFYVDQTGKKQSKSSQTTNTVNTHANETVTASQSGVQKNNTTTGGSIAVNTATTREYILNNNSYKFHLPDCGSVKRMKAPKSYTGTFDEIRKMGYEPCKNCLD